MLRLPGERTKQIGDGGSVKVVGARVLRPKRGEKNNFKKWLNGAGLFLRR